MRLTCLLAVLSAVLSAGTAQACCFFKCFRHSAPPAVPAFPTAPIIRETDSDTTAPQYMSVTTVGSVQADQTLGTLSSEVDPRPYVEIVVETDAWTGEWCDINLHVSDGTPRAVATAAMMKVVGKKPRIVFKERRVKKPKAVAAPAPTGGTAPPPPPPPPPAYEFVFQVYDLEYYHSYQTYAYSNSCLISSSAITFLTKQDPGSPPAPPGGASTDQK